MCLWNKLPSTRSSLFKLYSRFVKDWVLLRSYHCVLYAQGCNHTMMMKRHDSSIITLGTWKRSRSRTYNLMAISSDAFPLTYSTRLGVQGWSSGESTRLLPMWPGFDSQTRRHMWVEFFGSLLCTERFFSGFSGFPSPQKPTFYLICVNN